MKNTLLITTLVTGLALTGCSKSTRTDSAYSDTTPPATTTEPTVGQRVDNATAATGDALADAGRSMQDASRDAAQAMRNAGNEISAEMREWRLSAQELEADLRAERDIVRTKSTAGAPTGNVDKSMLKQNVENNVAQHKSAIEDLDVEIDNETEVVLTGEARSAEQVGQAIGAALQTEGVTKVTSKIKLQQ